MAVRNQGTKNRKRKHFEMEKTCQSPFTSSDVRGVPAGVVSKVPRGINAAEFAEARALEIRNMIQALETSRGSCQSGKRIFQSLPRHMRRRAASHNSKRMPVRLREAYKREAAKSQEKMKEPKQKKTRRHRRKPSSLLEEYSRRQRKHAWLETHIWHAKRFKMVEQWGYKIPFHPNDKSVRASYRAMARGCLMEDISYYQCIELCGRQEMIIDAMKHLTCSDIGLTMMAEHYLDGSCEGHTILYKYDQYPFHAIGPVMFLWKQCWNSATTEDQENWKSTSSVVRKLWVWSHPACSEAVFKEIVQACSLEGPTEHENTKPWFDKETNEVGQNKEPDAPAAADDVSPAGSPEFVVAMLHEQLTRFRFIGPKSHALLAATLELCDWGSAKDKAGSRWWEQFINNEDKRKTLARQNDLWEQLKGRASNSIQPGSVIGLVVKDPRLGLPLRKCSIDMTAQDLYTEDGEETTAIELPNISAVSPLWDCKVRHDVKQSKIPEKDLNSLRSKLSVPGSKLDLGDDASRIPILIIHQPSSTDDLETSLPNFGCGYDVVFPAGWSMAFWVALVYRGARVGGARELATCSREKGAPHFPCDFPDTAAGREYNEEQKRSGEEKYKRYPPAKRPNYGKFGMSSPFSPDWITLVTEWSKEARRLEREMKKIVSSESSEVLALKKTAPDEEKSVEATVASSECNGTLKNNGCGEDTEGEVTGLAVEVDGVEELKCQLAKTCDGVIRDFADCEGLNTGNRIDVDAEKTNCTSSEFNVIRALSFRGQLQHINKRLTLAMKRKRSRKISCDELLGLFLRTVMSFSRSLLCLSVCPVFKGCPQDNAVIYIPSEQDMNDLRNDKNYGGPVERVHKTKDENSASCSLITQCSRKAIGWVTSGQFSFARGRGAAVGFCSFPGFCELMMSAFQEKHKPLVLVRNTATYQYRFARVIVV